jgi:hypothetical protein
MVTFKKIPPATLDVKTGKLTGLPQKPTPPTIGSMSIPEFHRQVIDLANKKVPLAKAHAAIDQHPEIQDKEKAKGMAGAVYDILGKK